MTGAASEFEQVRHVVMALRRIRADSHVPPRTTMTAYVRATPATCAVLHDEREVIERMSNATLVFVA
jgi:valyl-tRNA synthetase